MWQQGANATLTADTDISENIDMFMLKCDVASPLNNSYVDQINYYYRINKLIAAPNGPYVTTTSGEKPFNHINFKIRHHSALRSSKNLNTSLIESPRKLTPPKVAQRPNSDSSSGTILNEPNNDKKDDTKNTSFTKTNKIVTFSENLLPQRKGSSNFAKTKLNAIAPKSLRNSIEREKLYFGRDANELAGLRIQPTGNQTEKSQFNLLSSRLAMDKTLKPDANKLTKSVSQKFPAALRYSANNLPPIEPKNAKLKKSIHKSASNAELSFQDKRKLSNNKEQMDFDKSDLNGFSDDENDTLVEEAFENDLFFG